MFSQLIGFRSVHLLKLFKLPSTWKSDGILVGFFLGLCAILFFLPSGLEDELPTDQEVDFAVAEVLETDNSAVGQYGTIRQGEQFLELRIITGRFSGEEHSTDNKLDGILELDWFYQKGDRVYVALNLDNGEIVYVNPQGPYRLGVQLWLAVLFAVCLVAVCGWTGIKALLSFIFTALMIWKVLIPLFIWQYDPVLVALGVVAVLTGAITFLIGGLTKKGLVAFLGGLLGLLLTCALVQLFIGPFQIHGAIRPFAKSIMQRYPEINITKIFLAGIFIASSGAVMDLAMDISASMNEIVKKKPDIKRGELILSGLSVGRAVIGTMTTTLLLAYSGGYMSALMWFMAQGIPIQVMLNTNFLAAEMMNTLAGSFGLVTVAPFTAIVGGIIYTRKKRVDCDK